MPTPNNSELNNIQHKPQTWLGSLCYCVLQHFMFLDFFTAPCRISFCMTHFLAISFFNKLCGLGCAVSIFRT